MALEEPDSSPRDKHAAHPSVSANRNRHGSGLSSSSASSSFPSLLLPTPPDGGWGWVVVFASFMAHCIADGCSFSFGVLYVELLDYFKESKGKTAWVGSLFVSVPLITGPLASAVTNRYGCRVSTMLGGAITAVGFVASAFANSVEMLCITFGLVAGFGLSLVYVPAVVIVAFYFEKKRSFATGLAVAGSGIGTFVFAPLIEYLIKAYSWRGAVIILGGLMLNIVVCGAIFRPLETSEQKRRRVALRIIAKASLSLHHSPAHHPGIDHRPPDAGLDEAALLSLLEELETPVAHSLVALPTYLSKDVSSLISSDIILNIDHSHQLRQALTEKLRQHDTHSPSHLGLAQDRLKHHETRSLTDVTTPSHQRTGQSSNCKDGDADKTPRTNGHTVATLGEQELLWCKQPRGPRFPHPNFPQQHNAAFYRHDIFYRGSLGQRSSRVASCPDLAGRYSDSSSSSSLSPACSPPRLLRFSREVKQVMREMLDMHILSSPVFVYFSISCMLLYMWYDVPYVYTPDLAIISGVEDYRASWIVSIIGIVSTIGQIIIGYIGDLATVDTLLLYNVLTSVAGASVLVLEFHNKDFVLEQMS